MSLRATIQDKTTKINEYIRKMAPADEVLSEYCRQQKPNEEENKEQETSKENEPLTGMPRDDISGRYRGR